MQTLRVALVLEPSGGGSGRHVLDLAEELSQLGHDITVFWSPVRAEEDFCERLKSLDNVKNVPTTMHRAVGLHDFSDLKALTRLLKAHGPFDVLHGHSSKAGALVRLLPAKVPGLRIYTSHALRTMDPDISAKSKTIYGGIERLLARRADKIIAVSAAEKRHAVEMGIPEHKVVVVANGAAPDTSLTREQARAAFNVEDDALVVGFIGRFVDQKDPLRFVESVRIASEKLPNLHAVMMGDGDLMQQARENAGRAPISFMGWCNAPELICGLDLLCVTSRYEALAYSFLEALHASVPILSSAVGGVEETILDNETGIVLPVDAPSQQFAEKLVEILGNPAKLDDFAAASRSLASERTVSKMALTTLDVYRDGGNAV